MKAMGFGTVLCTYVILRHMPRTVKKEIMH